MSRFGKNPKKEKFLNSLPVTSIDSGDLAARCKFNFSYFHHDQICAHNFSDLDKDSLAELLDKLKEYSKFPLQHWLRTRVGGSGRTVLENYGAFPKRSEFSHPSHVPHDALWSRFRLEGAVRLVGFVVPSQIAGTSASNCIGTYCSNTFYVVFIDTEHKFYLQKK